jgi:hypothetical protein
MSKLPNFFIVGAPKCGTTALYSYLKQHPQIFMSPHKEPTFFGRDLLPACPYFVGDWEAYKALFEGAENYPVVGEASVYYLVSESAASEIHAIAPDAKIVIMIRNPIDMMHSLHGQLLYSGAEKESSFMHALSQEESRRRIGFHSNQCVHQALLYRNMATYSVQIERYFEAFGRENVHVILLEEFIKNKSGIYKELLSFLGVDESYLPEFPVVNSNKEVRFGTLQSFLRKRPKALRDLAKWILPVSVKKKIIGPFIRRLKRLNTRVSPREPIPSWFREKIRTEFQGEIIRLERLLNRDIPY